MPAEPDPAAAAATAGPGPLARRWAALDPQLRTAALGRARQAIGFAAGTGRAAWPYVDEVTERAIVAAAEADRGTAWPRLLLSDYARYWRDGVRTAYEQPAGELRRRTATAALAAALHGQPYLDEAADGLLQLCEQSTWCWAAHERFAAVDGRVVPDVDRPFLDLGAAETVAVLAWADLILGAALDERTPGLRHRMRREAHVRVVAPFLGSREWHWLGLDGHLHNWNPWIHGHLLAAALFLVDDADVRTRTVDLVVDGLDRYLNSLPADGGCDEGYAYWWNGPARLAEALDLLDRVLGGRLDPWRWSPLPQLARYPHRMALGDGWYVNVGDGPARPSAAQAWQVPHRWGRATGDRQVVAHAASHRAPGGPAVTVAAGLGRAVRGLTDPQWITQPPTAPPLPATTWLPDLQLLVSRERAGSTAGLTVAVKGGHNDENHNHNDVGSYLVALDGCPVLVDLGQPTYTAISFTDRRYEQWVTQSQWHNLPVVGGHGQAAGRDFRASSVAVHTGADADTLGLDLAGAYPPEAGCRSWRRQVRLDRRRSTVTVTERWRVDDPADLRLHHVLAGEPLTHAAGRLAVRTLAGGSLVLTWDSQLGAGRLDRQPVDDPLLRDVWGDAVHRLVLSLPAQRTGSVTVTVSGGSE
ncbi:heparinase II/III family protein [Solwaraspora sp. WMMD937]|uniref:heparinase II/III domain-containing protein n=1 Tax=Solwaraspora sp. WMMD937 TaxID=3016090 RepID=UPI00249C7512|nr:heparinase II/III family protein [Solwaraspora sp. WMMD937]WFE19628.1 heparinase II/III family protein [Solwaraspora sp. WMMD937]